MAKFFNDGTKVWVEVGSLVNDLSNDVLRMVEDGASDERIDMLLTVGEVLLDLRDEVLGVTQDTTAEVDSPSES